MFETQSEQDFYNFCRGQRWTAAKLKPVPNLRTPDFKVSTQTGYEFVAEVTEFEPDPVERGEVRVRHVTVGNAIRAKLTEKKAQIRRFADEFPTVIVISGGFEHGALLDAQCFDSALYGELALGVRVPHDPRLGPKFDEQMHNAGRRFFGPQHNTSISAAAALDRRPQFLRFFHNRYAKIPLEPTRLLIGTRNVLHFVKPDSNSVGWQEVGAQNA
jgi:hypothetical protein